VKKIFLISVFILFPAITQASIASDFTVNPQSTYAVPRDVSNVLVLDLTLPEPKNNSTLQLKSIKIHNAGTATHLDISKLRIWEDGASKGWDSDEVEVVKVTAAPFFDTVISGDFRQYAKGDSWQRIFITLDTSSVLYSLQESSLKLELVAGSVVFSDSSANGPIDASVFGFERSIVRDAQIPSVPITPLAGTPKALSTSIIRWYFTDLSDNEFGFKLLDGTLKQVARKEEANLSYLDETGLNPNTEYSGRRVVAFNDRGESTGSTLTVFPAARTLALAPVAVPVTTSTEIVTEEPKQEVVSAPTLFETIQTKIADIQRQINELIKQLDELIKQSAASVFGALQGFFQSFFGK